MNFTRATALYETWLGRRLCLVPADVDLKHQRMRSAVFPFLRATYYRWAQTWAEHCAEAAKGPRVLAVGDLHVENFGTWRDSEGRLIWGINDFDEAWPLPYTNDLVRLATSALLARLGRDPTAVVAPIVQGYRDALAAGGRPYALAENHPALRIMATARLHDPEKYWQKLQALPEFGEDLPAGARKGIARLMPEQGLHWHVAHRVAGLGSLGRQRFVAVAEWRGGSVAREAKALAPSACLWAQDGKGAAPLCYQKILDRSVRCPDPFVRVQSRWIVRRLAPDCSRIELSSLPEERDEFHLLHGMGFETANIHLGSRTARSLIADFDRRPKGWLLQAARKMERAVRADFADYN